MARTCRDEGSKSDRWLRILLLGAGGSLKAPSVFIPAPYSRLSISLFTFSRIGSF